MATILLKPNKIMLLQVFKINIYVVCWTKQVKFLVGCKFTKAVEKSQWAPHISSMCKLGGGVCSWDSYLESTKKTLFIFFFSWKDRAHKSKYSFILSSDLLSELQLNRSE